MDASKIAKVGMMGAGSMGAGITLHLMELGFKITIHDPNEANVRKLGHDAKALGLDGMLSFESDNGKHVSAVRESNQAVVFILSLPHGSVADKVVEGLRAHLKSGDIIIDCGNEHYENTERRQSELEPHGIYYIGCGVSGGYQSARSGPSMSPGGDREVIESLMPFIDKLAAKDKSGRPCAINVGPGGSGHYVKMIHNGIEQGMMSALAEIWFIMLHGLGMSYAEIEKTLRSWNDNGPLHDCFLVDIAADILRTKDDQDRYVLDSVRDKVVQDVEESEGTGTWTCQEAVGQHIPAASIMAAHLSRCASAYASARDSESHIVGDRAPSPKRIQASDRQEFIYTLQRTTYFCFLSCFVEGFNILRARDKQRGWNLDYSQLLQLWRGGCIIQADGIVDLLDHALRRGDTHVDDLFENAEIATELSANLASVKQTVLRATEADCILPTISQSFEHFKYVSCTHLPDQFVEAELDYFGQHMYDSWDEPPGGPKTGQHHYEWKPAKGILDAQPSGQ